MTDKYGLEKARRDVRKSERAPAAFRRALLFVVGVWCPAVFLVAWAFGWGIFAK